MPHLFMKTGNWEVPDNHIREYLGRKIAHIVEDRGAGSPIELLMALAFECVLKDIQDVKVRQQEEVGSYRVDFLITSECTDLKIVVECDGHDFHEKTKDQAMNDKRRDRTLQSMGLRVFRFTGSEIWKNPFECAYEIFEVFFDDMHRAHLGRGHHE